MRQIWHSTGGRTFDRRQEMIRQMQMQQKFRRTPLFIAITNILRQRIAAATTEGQA